jgi:hypothetical protein
MIAGFIADRFGPTQVFLVGALATLQGLVRVFADAPRKLSALSAASELWMSMSTSLATRVASIETGVASAAP